MSNICKDAAFIMKPIVSIVKILRWVVPILLIVLITFDLFKVVAGNPDDKVKKDAFSKIVKRLIYAVIIFLVPSLVNIVLTKIAPISRDTTGKSGTSTSYLECWNYYYNNK